MSFLATLSSWLGEENPCPEGKKEERMRMKEKKKKSVEMGVGGSVFRYDS